MTERDLIRTRFLDFVFQNVDALRLNNPGMSETEAAKLVMGVAFDTLTATWKDAYGSRYMAEYFYRVADGFVGASNQESAK
jgi:hypothetical protein